MLYHANAKIYFQVLFELFDCREGQVMVRLNIVSYMFSVFQSKLLSLFATCVVHRMLHFSDATSDDSNVCSSFIYYR